MTTSDRLTPAQQAAVTRALLVAIRDGRSVAADKRHAVGALAVLDPIAFEQVRPELAELGLDP